MCGKDSPYWSPSICERGPLSPWHGLKTRALWNHNITAEKLIKPTQFWRFHVKTTTNKYGDTHLTGTATLEYRNGDNQIKPNAKTVIVEIRVKEHVLLLSMYFRCSWNIFDGHRRCYCVVVRTLSCRSVHVFTIKYCHVEGLHWSTNSISIKFEINTMV